MVNGQPRSVQHLKFRLLQRAHSFEKALALSNVRPFFGKAKMIELDRLIQKYRSLSLDESSVEFKKALSAVKSYLSYHQDYPLPNDLVFLTERYGDELAVAEIDPSVVDLTRELIRQEAKGDFRSLAFSRFSARQFTPEEVAIDLVADAVQIAQRSPSVCNRQSSHVFLINDQKIQDQVLDIQAGSGGFAQEINKILVVTSSLQSFGGANERNQGYVDGGLFSMSLMYALHYNGLGVCPLNWSADKSKDIALRRVLELPDDHLVIMLLAIGHLKEHYRVARSPRRPLADVFSVI